MPGIILFLQIASGGAWAIVLVYFAPSIARLWRQTHTDGDLQVSVYPLMAATQIGFAVRWFLFPGVVRLMQWQELVFWSGLYVASIVLAFFALWAGRTWQRN